jgi:predicted transcriptional regulator
MENRGNEMLDDLPTVSTKIDQGTFTCNDLLKCVFNLSETDIAILNMLSETHPLTAHQVGKSIKKDRSSSYRGLEKMVSCGLIYKERRGGTPRGSINVYFRIPQKELYKKAEQILDRCYTKIKKTLSTMN